MTRSDPEIKFSTDVTDVVEGLKNSGYATTNGDVVMFGATLGYKYGLASYAATTHLYVRLGVLVRQANFETYTVALMLANRQRYGHTIDSDSLSLERNLSYLGQMANSGLIHLKNQLVGFNKEASVLVPEMIHEALGLKTDFLSNEELSEIAKNIGSKPSKSKGINND